MLPAYDHKFLSERAGSHSVAAEANMTCVVLPGFRLPDGLKPAQSDLLVRISPGYPDVAPDMWWFDPPVARADGQPIPATQVMERCLGRNWQRWSRHLAAGQWRSGVDGLETFLAIIRRELDKASSGNPH